MITDNGNEFSSQLPTRGRLLGLDLGTKTIGLALSDSSRQIATPMQTIRRISFRKDVAKLEEILSEHLIAGFVLGLPINMNGTEGPRCQSTRDFARNLIIHLSVPILLWDERLSTSAADHVLLAADMSRQKRAAVVDKIAAALILQAALDALENIHSP
tara:strand:- start:106 stop:579 length:474 start_codon:yes stop_codon:yes gene_type:complete